MENSAMSTLVEIEAAADALSSEEKEELLRFLAMRLRQCRSFPKPRIYSDEELAGMFAENETDGNMLRKAISSAANANVKSTTEFLATVVPHRK
jgi:hypothetical protein